MSEVQTINQIIDSKQAESFLSRNGINRAISKTHVNYLANQMRNGLWLNDPGEPIIISKEGILLDGQHRLTAIMQTGLKFSFQVCYNVDKKVFSILNTGKRRSSSDTLSAANVKNYVKVSAIINAIHRYDTGWRDANGGMDIEYKLTNTEVLNKYLENQDYYQELVRESERYYDSFSKILDAKFIAKFIYVFSKIDRTDCTIFFNELCIDGNVSNSTISVLRKKYIEDRLSLTKLPPYVKEAIIIKTWNAFRTKRIIKVLKFDKSVEEFPKPI